MKAVSQVRKHTTYFITELKELLAIQLVLSGCSESDSVKGAENIIQEVMRSFSGMNIYISKERRQCSEETRSLLYDDYKKGVDVCELALKYDLSIQWAYRLVNDERTVRRELLGCRTMATAGSSSVKSCPARL